MNFELFTHALIHLIRYYHFITFGTPSRSVPGEAGGVGGVAREEGGVGGDGAVLGDRRAGGVVGAALHLKEVDAAAVVEDGLGVGADEEERVVDLDLGAGLVHEEVRRGRRGDGRTGVDLDALEERTFVTIPFKKESCFMLLKCTQ